MSCSAITTTSARSRRKVDLELGYAAHAKGTRWTFPSRWYSFQYPQKDPVITFICLDTNLPGMKKGADKFLPWSFEMKKEDRDQQDAWFRAELAKPRTTPFVACVAHHPLYTNGIHRDQKILIRDWDALLRQYKVDFWISGHDHDLQHLEFAGHPTSFVISGGGGAELVDWTTPPEKRGPFGEQGYRLQRHGVFQGRHPLPPHRCPRSDAPYLPEDARWQARDFPSVGVSLTPGVNLADAVAVPRALTTSRPLNPPEH